MIQSMSNLYNVQRKYVSLSTNESLKDASNLKTQKNERISCLIHNPLYREDIHTHQWV